MILFFPLNRHERRGKNDDRRRTHRLQLAEAAKRILGDDEGITLMELLPSVGWVDVATKQDLEILEHRLEAKFERGIRTVMVTMMALFTVGVLATIAATMVAVALR